MQTNPPVPFDFSVIVQPVVELMEHYTALIKVCIAVRKARTYFDEAAQISWSIYNIALVNCVMAAIQ